MTAVGAPASRVDEGAGMVHSAPGTPGSRSEAGPVSGLLREWVDAEGQECDVVFLGAVDE